MAQAVLTALPLIVFFLASQQLRFSYYQGTVRLIDTPDRQLLFPALHAYSGVAIPVVVLGDGHVMKVAPVDDGLTRFGAVVQAFAPQLR
jgi:hypothetical protein